MPSVMEGIIRSCSSLLLLAGLAACGGGGGGSAAPAPEVVAAEATLGPAGGTVSITTGVHAGVTLTVPPGALTTPTQIGRAHV